MKWIENIKDGYDLSNQDGIDLAIIELRGAREFVGSEIDRLQALRSEIDTEIIRLYQNRRKEEVA